MGDNMAHRISITNVDFVATNRGDRPADGGIFVRPTEVDKTAKLVFTGEAYAKMTLLVQTSEKEVGWHGVCTRENEDVYVIRDILVYPQKAKAAFVESDDNRIAEWVSSLDDDTINNMRMQGHSHVNMGVSPSGKDIMCENDFLSQLGKDDFYVFLIWNKKGEKTVRIFDYEKDVVFETDDVDVYVGEVNIDDFVVDARRMVTNGDEYKYIKGGEYYGFDEEF